MPDRFPCLRCSGTGHPKFRDPADPHNTEPCPDCKGSLLVDEATHQRQVEEWRK